MEVDKNSCFTQGRLNQPMCICVDKSYAGLNDQKYT